MKSIVGLGNPGIRYQRTRHNVGRQFVEFLAGTFKVSWRREKKIQGMTAKIMWAGRDVLLCYPEVFMNTSGETIQRLLEDSSLLVAEDLLVAVDDVDLPFSHLRLRGKGSSGGHNGLKSIEAAVGHCHYPRLRIGIGRPGLPLTEDSCEGTEIPSDDLAEFVLEEFSAAEMSLLPKTFGEAQKACHFWLTQPMEQAMNAVNRRSITD